LHFSGFKNLEISKMLTDKEIKEFKRLAKETMGLDLTDAEAQDQGSRLVSLFELLIDIDRKNKQKEHGKNQKVHG